MPFILPAIGLAAFWAYAMATVVYDAFSPQPGLEDDRPILALRYVNERRAIIIPQLVMLAVALPL